jgi:hypothetical protein
MAGLFFIEVGNNVGGTGWNLAITAGAGAQPTFASDVGELDISFSNTGVAGEVRIVAQHSIQMPAGEGLFPGPGETVDFNLVVNGSAGTVIGTIVGKGMGKGR